jgi:hypothetical protein
MLLARDVFGRRVKEFVPQKWLTNQLRDNKKLPAMVV